MIIHNFSCRAGHITEKWVDVNEKDWRNQPCEFNSCPLQADQTYVSRRVQALHRKPVTIYKNSLGEVRFPGSSDEPMPENYKSQGFQRVEMNFQEARKFQKQFSLGERAKESDKLEFLHYMESEARKQDRSDLITEMQHFSNRGREFAQAAIDQSDKEYATKYYSQDPGFYIEAIDG